MSLWKKANKWGVYKAGENMASAQGKPRIENVSPRAAIPGGEWAIQGSGFTENGRSRPTVRFGTKQVA